jgi:5-methyltetrahydrofolate--homocysteine methyltransferase
VADALRAVVDERRDDMDILAELAQHLLSGDDQKVSELTRQAIAAGLPPKQILDDGLIAGMTIVGERFKCHDLYLPDVLMAAQAMNAGLEHLKPLLVREGVPSLGKVVLGSVLGDLHDIGKNLVGVLLKGAGFEVVDLGSDVAPERFVEAATQHAAAIIGMSALLTTTMPEMARVVALLKEQRLDGRFKTIIGGAPVTERYAREIGADAYGFDAANAVERVKGLMGK